MSVPPRIQNFRNIVSPLRYMMRWFFQLMSPKQLIFPQDTVPTANHLLQPISVSRRCAQRTAQTKIIKDQKNPVENLVSRHRKNISAFHETAQVSPPLPTSIRVFREHDRNVASHCAGRMIISGRMKDVCAEIDRLANKKE